MTTRWLARLADSNPWSPPRPLPGEVVVHELAVRLFRSGDGARLYEAIPNSAEPSCRGWRGLPRIIATRTTAPTT